MNEFNRTQKRKADVIKPPNVLKAKVGSGGLSENILDKAQKMIENNTVDFIPLAEMYLEALSKSIDAIKNGASEHDDDEYSINSLIYPIMQLKSNGGMFKYPLISDISASIIQFLEVIEKTDSEVVEIVTAFHTTIRAIISNRIQGSGGDHGKALIKELSDACHRYLDKHPENREEQA